MGQRSARIGTTVLSAKAMPTEPATASAWPAPSGTSARSTAARRRSCIPSATANSHPIPGLIPWKAPSAIRVSTARSSSKAIGVGARVAAFQVHLVRTHAVELHEPGGIERDAAVGAGVDLGQPALDPVGIELFVPAAIQR